MTKKQFRIAVTALLILYVVIFAARYTYDMLTYKDPSVSAGYQSGGFRNELRMTSNVASFRKEYAGETVGSVEILEQKYEQVATVTAKTVAFDSDLLKLDDAVEQAQAVIQAETAQGLAGSRTLTRVIGVKPQYFDGLLETVKQIGLTVTSTSQKTDKTYEYRQMLAQKQELEKRLESYKSLRGRSGSVNEMLSLEDKIIEVESLLLQQAVDLGEYSDDNALCTINISLYEGNPANPARVIFSSLKWAAVCYFSVLGGIILICLTAVILTKTYIFFSRIVSSVNKKILGEKDEAAE